VWYVQGFSEAVMLKALLRAAVDWIVAGLPLQLLKIVIFTQSPSTLTSSDKEKIEIFKNFEEFTKTLKATPEVSLSTLIRYVKFLRYPKSFHELC
jgi:hypothetical protein